MDQNAQIEAPKIVETPVAAVELPEEGSELHGSDGHEVIVHDRDADGNVIGWHKEVVNG